MRTITLEEHFTTAEFLKATDAHSQRDLESEFLRRVRGKLLDVGEGRIADMDAGGIHMQVLSLAAGDMDRLDTATANFVARDANDAMAAAVEAHPDRFAAFATLNLREPETAACELQRCIRR